MEDSMSVLTLSTNLKEPFHVDDKPYEKLHGLASRATEQSVPVGRIRNYLSHIPADGVFMGIYWSFESMWTARRESRPIIFANGLAVAAAVYDFDFAATRACFSRLPAYEQRALGENTEGVGIILDLEDYKTRAIRRMSKWLREDVQSNAFKDFPIDFSDYTWAGMRTFCITIEVCPRPGVELVGFAAISESLLQMQEVLGISLKRKLDRFTAVLAEMKKKKPESKRAIARRQARGDWSTDEEDTDESAPDP
ncbi:hypothetical protein LTR17_001411 [Elasticomyces elasticus]|nr:hypothetical protein LTR17_001411 [Elasticomyces elasticus]